MSLSLNTLTTILNGIRSLVSSPKTNWTTEDNKGVKKVVQSSHPPQEAILFNHRGTENIVASPFKFPTEEEKVVKKVIEQNNYTN